MSYLITPSKNILRGTSVRVSCSLSRETIKTKPRNLLSVSRLRSSSSINDGKAASILSTSTSLSSSSSSSLSRMNLIEKNSIFTRRMSQVHQSTGPQGKTPVSWPMLGILGVAAAASVSYYRIQRERRLEEAMGKIVTSESNSDENLKEGAWSPGPAWAKRVFKRTKFGWMPVEEAFSDSGKPAIGGSWSLVDLEGRLVTEQTFAGKWVLLYFGFARCPDICPSEMVKVAKIMHILEKENPELHDKIIPLFVSVDPARDSLKALKEYAKDFHPRYVFLTGLPQQVQEMAKKYRVYVSKADETEDGDYLVDHSIVIYFHDDKGELADVYTQSMKPTDVVEKVVRAMTFQSSI